MSIKMTKKLAAGLANSVQEDDVFLERLKHHELEHLCESIVEELADKKMINGKLTSVRLRRPAVDRAASQYLRETIELALMSFEERTELPLAGKLVAYSELVQTVYNILVKPD